jgi:Fe-Mn family superoxide dismutase
LYRIKQYGTIWRLIIKKNKQNNFILTNNFIIMNFTLPELPYALNALEPVISEETLNFHYGKHHQTYVTNLNNLIKGTEFENADLDTIVKKADGTIFNNAAQTWNHNFYFLSLTPKSGSAPSASLLKAINAGWGSLDTFKDEFNKAAVSLFGSGWAWLVKDADGKLSIVKESNAGNPLTHGLTPILTFDVWEHAYYVDYRNRRADHVAALWNIIDWNVISARF